MSFTYDEIIDIARNISHRNAQDTSHTAILKYSIRAAISEYSGYSRDVFRFGKERLLENWDRHIGERRGVGFFERFWRPKRRDFAVPKPRQRPEDGDR